MNVPPELRCMICQRQNPEAGQGPPPMDWGVTTDKAGDVFGVICPTCITGEIFAIAGEDNRAEEAA
jgi:hypothetical protein